MDKHLTTLKEMETDRFTQDQRDALDAAINALDWNDQKYKPVIRVQLAIRNPMEDPSDPIAGEVTILSLQGDGPRKIQFNKEFSQTSYPRGATDAESRLIQDLTQIIAERMEE